MKSSTRYLRWQWLLAVILMMAAAVMSGTYTMSPGIFAQDNCDPDGDGFIDTPGVNGCPVSPIDLCPGVKGSINGCPADITPEPTEDIPIPDETPTPTEDPQPGAPPDPCGVINNSKLRVNVHPEPSQGNEVPFQIPPGARANILYTNEDGSWLYIDYGGRQGWVLKSAIDSAVGEGCSGTEIPTATPTGRPIPTGGFLPNSMPMVDEEAARTCPEQLPAILRLIERIIEVEPSATDVLKALRGHALCNFNAEQTLAENAPAVKAAQVLQCLPEARGGRVKKIIDEIGRLDSDPEMFSCPVIRRVSRLVGMPESFVTLYRYLREGCTYSNRGPGTPDLPEAPGLSPLDAVIGLLKIVRGNYDVDAVIALEPCEILKRIQSDPPDFSISSETIETLLEKLRQVVTVSETQANTLRECGQPALQLLILKDEELRQSIFDNILSRPSPCQALQDYLRDGRLRKPGPTPTPPPPGVTPTPAPTVDITNDESSDECDRQVATIGNALPDTCPVSGYPIDAAFVKLDAESTEPRGDILVIRNGVLKADSPLLGSLAMQKDEALPALSPGGDRVAFLEKRNGIVNLNIVPADYDPVNDLSSINYTNENVSLHLSRLAWYNDEIVLFSGTRTNASVGGIGIYVVNRVTREVKPFIPDAFSPAFSPIRDEENAPFYIAYIKSGDGRIAYGSVEGNSDPLGFQYLGDIQGSEGCKDPSFGTWDASELFITCPTDDGEERIIRLLLNYDTAVTNGLKVTRRPAINNLTAAAAAGKLYFDDGNEIFLINITLDDEGNLTEQDFTPVRASPAASPVQALNPKPR